MADVMSAISADTSAFEKAIDADFKGMEGAASFKKMGEQLAKMWKGTVMGFVQKQATHISDLCQAVADLEEKLEEVTVRETCNKQKLEEMEKFRETNEVKASRQEMAKKMEAAVTQVKILDMNFDKEIDDHKEMLNCAKIRLRAKVKASEQERFGELVKKAVVQVLAKKTVKRKARDDGRDIWTAPIILTMKEQQERWEMEDLLRRNKIYPTFHWPKEFLEPMKKMREELAKQVDEESHYTRIRPVQTDGKWRIRADVKPKDGSGRFLHKATWEMPPLDEETRSKVPDWFKPTSWAGVVRGRGASVAAPPPEVGREAEADMET